MNSITNIVDGIIEKGGKILLLEKIKHGDYTFPGGKCDVGESDVEALKREILEEIGVLVRVDGFVGAYHFRSGSKDFQRNVFKVIVEEGTPRICEPDVFSNLIYMTPNKTSNLFLAPQIGQAIKDYHNR